MKPKYLKISIYLVIFLLILSFGFSWISYEVSPIKIMKYLGAQAVSGVGMSVSVPENPFNAAAKQLKEKELRLKEKEEFLAKREQESKIIYNIILILILFLFFLIFFNFYLDFRARRNVKRI